MSPGGDKPQFAGGRHLAHIERQRRRSWWLLWLTLACALLFAFGAAESVAVGVHGSGEAVLADG